MVLTNLVMLLLFHPPLVLVLRLPTTALAPTLVLTTLAQLLLVLLPRVLVPLLVTMKASTLVQAILAHTPTVPLVTTAL